MRPVTRTLQCPIDVAALRRYVQTADPGEADVVPMHKDGTPYGATRRELARSLADEAEAGT